jgi:aldehyde dehydrogenase family 9 protein A1
MQRISTEVLEKLNYVWGCRTEPTLPDPDKFDVIEPATGRTLTMGKFSGCQDVDNAVSAAIKGFEVWSRRSGPEKRNVLSAAARLLESRVDAIAEIETRDCGKPIWETKGDILAAADSLAFFAGLAGNLHGDHFQLPGGSFAYTRREPLGVCVGIGAWNYPLQTACWKMAPALACGNAMVYKPSPLAPLSAVVLAEILTEAGVPPGVFNVVQGNADTGKLLSSHPDVAKVSFTGSVATGKKVMETASSGVKPVTLELGGKSPLIIFEDANLDDAVSGALIANYTSQGEVML